MIAFRNAIVGSLIVALVSTFGDYLWANAIPHGRAGYGLAHGVVLFLVVGACLGAPAGKAIAGAFGAALAGLIAAGSWYVLQPAIGYWTAMFVLWFGLWLMLGILTGRVLLHRGPWRDLIVRSLLAAVGSGVAFYLISGIWRPNNPRSIRDYAVHFASWTIAYLPAFAALLLVPKRRGRT